MFCANNFLRALRFFLSDLCVNPCFMLIKFVFLNSSGIEIPLGMEYW